MPAGWVSAAVGVYGAIKSSQAGHQAAGGATQGANLDQQRWNDIRGIEQPWTTTGGWANQNLAFRMGEGPGSGHSGYGNLMTPYHEFNYTGQHAPGAFNPTAYKPFTIDDFHKMSPAYAFQKEQGMQGVLNGSSANSGALSGAAQKDLIGYNQGFANTAFNNAFGQNMAEQQQRYNQQLGQYEGQLQGYNSQYGNQLAGQQQNFAQYNTQQGNIYSRLMGVSGMGQTAAGQLGNIGAGLGADQAQGYTNAGAARAWGTNNAAGGMMYAAQNVPWDQVASWNKAPREADASGLTVTSGDPYGGP